MAQMINRGNGGTDLETDEQFDASFHCYDCDLYLSWPVTPGLAPNEDPLQTEMLALVAEHTPAACRAAQVGAALDREKARAAEKAAEYAAFEDCIHDVSRLRLTAQEATEAEADGYPSPVGGDPVVTLQQAMDRGAVTVTRGLPEAVAWRRANPSLDGSYHPVRYMPRKERSASTSAFLWPAQAHKSLTDSITALAVTQRRLMIGGRLAPAG
jgi:hypothetical protein